MQKFAILASVVVLAAASANCANSDRNVLSPSSLNDSADATAAAKGGGKGKPGGGGSTSGSGSLTLVMVTDNNGNGAPNWADTVTFNVSTSATTQPTVELLCYQNGAAVYGATAGFYDSYAWPWTKNMNLASGAWANGAAECTATLFPLGARSSVLATLTFTAGA
jgi:hypothetical protein